MTTPTFEYKDETEDVVLTFDFSLGLSRGETLTGTPTVTVVCAGDATPTSILNGAASFDLTSKMVLQPVKSGIPGLTYEIKVVVSTTNAKKILALTALLPIN